MRAGGVTERQRQRGREREGGAREKNNNNFMQCLVAGHPLKSQGFNMDFLELLSFRCSR